MNWSFLVQEDQVRELEKESIERAILIFKHSTRCSTSKMVLARLERNWKEGSVNVKTYFLDLLSYRDISNTIENNFSVRHESPQVLIIRNGKTVFSCSHFDIKWNVIKSALQN
jgi:bacillithiol system protein YtxJ